MKWLDLLVDEHKNITRMLAVIRTLCYGILIGQKVEYGDFLKIVDFVRNYSDKHHHGKEENMLFNRMILELGDTADKLVRHGMLVEHDMGRLYMEGLENAVKKVMDGEDEARLDVIANAISYAHLMKRHIDKEDNVVYIYAKKNMLNATLDAINSEVEAYERSDAARKAREKYLPMLDEMEGEIR